MNRCEDDGHVYLEGDTGQSKRLEVSWGSLHRTQDETLLTGSDVIQPVAVERAHTGTEGRAKQMRRHQRRCMQGCNDLLMLKPQKTEDGNSWVTLQKNL